MIWTKTSDLIPPFCRAAEDINASSDEYKASNTIHDISAYPWYFPGKLIIPNHLLRHSKPIWAEIIMMKLYLFPVHIPYSHPSAHTHVHTHKYVIYVYMHMYKYICVFVCSIYIIPSLGLSESYLISKILKNFLDLWNYCLIATTSSYICS